MRFTLDVNMANSEGALERILGRLRQRNFVVCAMSAGCTPDFQRMDARITIESDRPVDLAVKQLSKLFDVDGVKIWRADEHAAESFTNPRQPEYESMRLQHGHHELAVPAYRHHAHHPQYGHHLQYEVRKGYSTLQFSRF